ncbi:homeodomain transcription factor [Lactarius sanguifluus]|nr:homeodomain transcription factor [Lactarius sanguifluus]
MAPIRADLLRSESSSSLGSSSDELVFSTSSSKRTRKRFTGSQLAMLEQLFHRASHPSREQRESLAQELGLYENAPPSPYSLTHSPATLREHKAVTIWFQNRRQNERKASITADSTFSSPLARPTPRRPRSSIPHSLSSPYAPQTPLAKRPTLEVMARRSELRTAPPRTPSKRPDPSKSLWDNMPSSPLAPPSPPEPEFVQFGMRKRNHVRSLEWACAAARLEGKRTVTRNDYVDSDDETDEEESHEAITPMGSLMGDVNGDVFLDRRSIEEKMPKAPEEELMGAALLLCGLGRKVS